jgi:chromosome segregation ATPase
MIQDTARQEKSVAHNYYELKIILDNLNNSIQDIKSDVRSIKDEFKEINKMMIDIDYRIRLLDTKIMNTDNEVDFIKKERRFFYIIGAIIITVAIFTGPQFVQDLLLMLMKRL